MCGFNLPKVLCPLSYRKCVVLGVNGIVKPSASLNRIQVPPYAIYDLVTHLNLKSITYILIVLTGYNSNEISRYIRIYRNIGIYRNYLEILVNMFYTYVTI